MSNIHGLGSVGKRDKDKNKNVEEFAQGGHQSSTAVYRPASGGNPLENLVDQARNQVPGDPSGAQGRNVCTITLYQNGFKIGDSEFRDSSDPKNAAFIESLKAGEVPQELQPEVRAQYGPHVDKISIALVNKTQEKFEVPFDFRKTAGQALGGAKDSGVDFSMAQPMEYKLDASQPKTKIQVVLHNRQRARIEVNHSTTVLQIYQHVMAVSGEAKFDLVDGFPPKPLTNPAATVAEAKLLGASLQQRLKK